MNPIKDQIHPEDKDRYSVIPRVLIFLFRSKSVLLIKGSSTKKRWPGKYNGLGGHLELGEDPLSAARRELKEESGLSCRTLSLCGNVIVNTGRNPGIAIYIFKGDYEGGEISPSVEGSLEWVELELLHQYPVVEDLRIILPKIAVYNPEAEPFYARYFYDEQDRMQIDFTV